MGRLYTALFWALSAASLSSGLLGFGLKLPGFYRPDAYLIGPRGSAGDGTTPFERCATFVFAVVYVGPLVGMGYAHVEGSRSARRAAAFMPLVYHAASVYGVLCAFPDALNPAVAPLWPAAAMHGVTAALFALMWYAAEDAPVQQRGGAGKGT